MRAVPFDNPNGTALFLQTYRQLNTHLNKKENKIMTDKEIYAASLRYHAEGKPGKTETVNTKPCTTPSELALAYSPGVAAPSLEIAADREKIYEYTGKGNLVAVISNGTAVLGLGNIGASASKPVMEGKCMLFKQMAGINAFDIEVDAATVDEFVDCVKRIALTFGGINLEDIKAPECFEIERRLREELDIPVMHDDQHGTAIIASAALLNMCHLTGKSLGSLRVVVSGAGAAAIATARMFLRMGVSDRNLILYDSRGAVTDSRTDLTPEQREFAAGRRSVPISESLVGADVFLGVSKPGTISADMVRTMAESPLIMALANPTPEISRDEALAARPDAIYASGRSDWPNQVNNLLGFPYIFRGALDVRAREINEEMKLAAARAIAELARKPIPEGLCKQLGRKCLEFGRDCLIPSPFDCRLMQTVAPAVARAAIESGVARKTDANV